MSHFFDTPDRHPDLELPVPDAGLRGHLGPYHMVFRQLAVVLMQVIPDRAAMLGCSGCRPSRSCGRTSRRTHETHPLIAKIARLTWPSSVAPAATGPRI